MDNKPVFKIDFLIKKNTSLVVFCNFEANNLLSNTFSLELTPSQNFI